jgi:hypothetical protein
MTRAEANRVRKGPNGNILGSHFASIVTARTFVINGYSLKQEAKDSSDSIRKSSQPGDPSSSSCVNGDCVPLQGGIPMLRKDLHGLGGGSFANHSATPNAAFVGDDSGHVLTLPLFLVATTPIHDGQFIHVCYGKWFLNSCISNIN